MNTDNPNQSVENLTTDNLNPSVEDTTTDNPNPNVEEHDLLMTSTQLWRYVSKRWLFSLALDAPGHSTTRNGWILSTGEAVFNIMW